MTAAEQDADDGLSDDLNSPNYRYAYTGYISGRRKEEAAGAIRKARTDVRILRVSDIDFAAIEENQREACKLVIKSNAVQRGRLGAHQPERRLRLAAEPQAGGRET